MQVKTLFELVEWTRAVHAHLAQCLTQCAARHADGRARLLLAYVATHETEMETMVATINQQSDAKAAHTHVFDYLPHDLVAVQEFCDVHYADLSADEINAEVFALHNRIIDLYRTLLRNAVIPEATALMQALLDMEENETRRLSRQIGRMDDL